MTSVIQDIRFALRSLRRSPGLALVALLTIGLAVGANTTVFTIMERFVLRPLPGVPETDRLVTLRTGAPSGSAGQVSYPDYRVWRERSRAFDGIAVESMVELSLRTTTGPAQRAWGAFASWNLFQTLRVQPTLGRAFAPHDEAQAAPTAVISHAFWQRIFAGDSGVMGRHVMLNGHDFTIIGVAPRGFGGTELGLAYDLWVPVTLKDILTPQRGALTTAGWRWLDVVARLRPGVSIEQARQDMALVQSALAQTEESDRGLTAVVQRFGEDRARGLFGRLTAVLLGVTALVLLIACANLANLLLARAVARRREIGIRLAVGAGRARLVRQLVTESLVLALGGGALGLLVAAWGRDSVYALIPAANIPIDFEMPLDARVFGFALAVTLCTGVLFSLVPALRACRVDVLPALRDGAATGSARRSRLQATLASVQVALAIVSLVCAGLFVRGLQRAQRVDTGIGDPDGVFLVGSNVHLAGYTSDSTGLPVVERLLAEVRAVPGVHAASLATLVPLGFEGATSASMEIEGYTIRPNESNAIPWSSVGPDYFETVGIPLVRGRGIAAEDRRHSQYVAVVSEAFARRSWPGLEALGRRVRFLGGPWRTVVGVARDSKVRALNEPPQPVIYLPFPQRYSARFTLHVRADGDPRQLQQALRRVFERVDPNLPFNDVRTFAENMRAATFAQEMGASMLTAFGLLAVGLAAIGLYGVLSYSVAQRTREMGIRIAVGASRRDVLGLVVGRAMRLTAVGLGAGLVLALGAGRLLRSQIFGVSPLDPVTFVGATAALAAVALLAAWLPARRAARVDPIVALQAE